MYPSNDECNHIFDYRNQKLLKIVQVRIFQNGDSIVYFNQPYLKEFIEDLEKSDMRIHFKNKKSNNLFQNQKEHIIKLPVTLVKEKKCEINRKCFDSNKKNQKHSSFPQYE